MVRLREETVEALSRYASDHVLALVTGDNGYWELLGNLWAAGEDFVIVEQDIGIHADVLPQFEACQGLWCAFPYQLAAGVAAALGCVRFREELLRAEPDLLVVVGQDASLGVPARHWARLDVRLERELQLRGYTRCLHTPAVAHYHEYP